MNKHKTMKGPFVKPHEQQLQIPSASLAELNKPTQTRIYFHKKPQRIGSVGTLFKKRNEAKATFCDTKEISGCLKSCAIPSNVLISNKKPFLRIQVDGSSISFPPQYKHRVLSSTLNKLRTRKRNLENMLAKSMPQGSRTLGTAPKIEKVRFPNRANRFLWLKLAEIKRRQYSNLTVVDKQNAIKALPHIITTQMAQLKTRGNPMFKTVQGDHIVPMRSGTSPAKSTAVKTLKSATIANFKTPLKEHTTKQKKTEVHFRVPCPFLDGSLDPLDY